MNDVRFGDGANDIEAEAAAAALTAYQQSIREQTTEEITERQDLVWGLLAGLMHYGDRTDADFTQALADAAREYAERRHEDPFYVGAVVDDGERLGVITGVDWETPEDFSYHVDFLDGATDLRHSGEIALADHPVIQLHGYNGYKVHTFARAQDELARLQAEINRAAETGRAPAPRAVRDREALLAGISEWARISASDLMSRLGPQIDEHSARLQRETSPPHPRGHHVGDAAELAHADFPRGVEPLQPRATTDSPPLFPGAVQQPGPGASRRSEGRSR